ncbi:MAG: tetratricopeptide repeat protein [Gammaproteobacteria bacterium]|nr:tetratricopeptide repeat protein [Gammaproteobacteria bacterium]
MSRHSHESAVSSLSLVLVGVLASALVMMAAQPDLARLSASASAASGWVEFGARARQAALRDPRLAEIDMRFQQGVMMLHARRYDEAVTAFHQVLKLSPRLVDAQVNMGYALLGLGRDEAARDFFLGAIDLRPYQGNAYWGLAEALENLGDIPGALGAMRTYIHLSPADDPYVRRARSALWEWDTQLARGPLPEAEAEWMRRRGKEWDARNRPDADAPSAPARQGISVRDLD